MPKYEIRTKRITLIEGQEVTPDDVLATVEINVDGANPRDVLSMVQFGNASLVCLDDVVSEMSDSDEEIDDEDDEDGDDGDDESTDDEDSDSDAESEESGVNPFANLNAKQQESLAVEGITTLSQASMWLSTHQTFEKLEHIGRATNLELVELIREAGFPVPEKY